VAIIDRVLEYVQHSGVTGVRAADVAITLRVAEDHAATMLSKLARRGTINRAARGLYVAKEPRRPRVDQLRRVSSLGAAMTDTGCPHPESELVTIESGLTVVWWCAFCGSIRDNNGDHGAQACAWRAPSGVVLPGWTCSCGGFNGSVKELLPACRGCGLPREPQRLTSDSSLR